MTDHWNAEHYRERHAFVFGASSDLITEWLRPERGERVLDLGCGTGELSARVAEGGAEVVGVDASPGMIEGAREAFAERYFPNLRFEVGDAHALTFASEFDAVFSNAALHWMAPLSGVFPRVAAALRPGGRFVLEMGGAGNVQTTLDAVEHATQTLGLPELPHPWTFPSAGELCTGLEAAGLRAERVHWFERPSLLPGEDGFRAWLSGFGGAWLAPLGEEDRAAVIREAEAYARPRLWNGGAWVSDYCRLRALAVRPG
ncbi:Methyltransferase domain-containing protein [Deinococcus reticulitermitis]|uniref:Methyltransferase domain-containing protein n=1 Tax=Deinococcus reticulitermitis TaxID=856736 RepID=A0A1H6WJN7_9DEIO|nr:class I SAM-dependent methyltransferase [Deinococcus reticulitermitis]SEJ12565.1 Methyltransferase domain-containing protein [Deinococcus reticulitermitis]